MVQALQAEIKDDFIRDVMLLIQHDASAKTQ